MALCITDVVSEGFGFCEVKTHCIDIGMYWDLVFTVFIKCD